MQKKLIITLKPDGTVDIEGEGYTDTQCLRDSALFEQALGVTTSQKKKDLDNAQAVRLNQGDT